MIISTTGNFIFLEGGYSRVYSYTENMWWEFADTNIRKDNIYILLLVHEVPEV